MRTALVLWHVSHTPRLTHPRPVPFLDEKTGRGALKIRRANSVNSQFEKKRTQRFGKPKPSKALSSHVQSEILKHLITFDMFSCMR